MSLEIEIQNYKAEIKFHLQEAKFWRKELKKVENLQKKYKKMKTKNSAIFLIGVSKLKNINKSDVIAFVLRG
ncbi:MAG: hypothetical protein RBT22_00570 [Aliarcobacter sp.]|jgi:hypothetical protein|nr:hypothetical protein [Aliarcobacter sp.]